MSDTEPTPPKAPSPPPAFDEKTRQRLTDDLRSLNDHIRRDTVLEIIRRGNSATEITAELKILLDSDPSPAVRLAAKKALTGEEPPENLIRPVHVLSSSQKFTEIMLGLVGWYVINGGLWWLLTSRQPLNAPGSEGLILNLFCLPANILTMGILALFRRWVALGMLISYASNFLLATLYGIFIYGVCWIPFFIK